DGAAQTRGGNRGVTRGTRLRVPALPAQPIRIELPGAVIAECAEGQVGMGHGHRHCPTDDGRVRQTARPCGRSAARGTERDDGAAPGTSPLAPVQDELVARLGRELESFVSPWEDDSRREEFIAFVLPRIVPTLDLLPPGTPESRLLELRADPCAESRCLSPVWRGRVPLANFCAPADRHGERTLVEAGGTRTRTFAYDLFNVEMDEFPYPDGTFDVVLFAEMIEHLAVNPVWALSEIHRVLKPGGHLIVTTPNALSIERVARVLT